MLPSEGAPVAQRRGDKPAACLEKRHGLIGASEHFSAAQALAPDAQESLDESMLTLHRQLKRTLNLHAVTNAADGLNGIGAFAHFFSKAKDMRIDGTVHDRDAFTLDHVDQAFAS